ncbi:MAG: hypothetical protein IJ461_00445 [Clostridia bacterium]|nr:hypothetical protein [Clostridia bacterium]
MPWRYSLGLAFLIGRDVPAPYQTRASQRQLRVKYRSNKSHAKAAVNAFTAGSTKQARQSRRPFVFIVMEAGCKRQGFPGHLGKPSLHFQHDALVIPHTLYHVLTVYFDVSL